MAVDSNGQAAIFTKLEIGIGAGINIADTAGFEQAGKIIDKISLLKDCKDIIFDELKGLDIDAVIPEDTGKVNFSDLEIEGTAFDGKNIRRITETVNDWKTAPAEGAVIVGANGDKDGNVSLSIGAKAEANVYLFSTTVYYSEQ